MDARNHPAVRRGTGWWRFQTGLAAVVFWGLAILLLREPTVLHVLGAVACIAGAGLALYFGQQQIRKLRHDYRYKDTEPSS
ncbi:hypothetical protein [Arthrobacter sp. YD2]|uniref:hypothetical protein n=1 Tax=Arthrobacter sp. YD2 TaxID=3058046 RepID=UPI0025B37183|nr:hypothetical protein [Arthrobacter sp. YD2]MDN3905824.1 hypothetical protein [Arthrobacter sp. YD2]